MAVTGVRTVTVLFTGEVTYTQTFTADTNSASPGQIEIKDLDSGDNTITPPSVTTVACVIIPPSDNIISITFKGDSGDTGYQLHDTDPFVLTLKTGATEFILEAGDDIAGVRLIWI